VQVTLVKKKPVGVGWYAHVPPPSVLVRTIGEGIVWKSDVLPVAIHQLAVGQEIEESDATPDGSVSFTQLLPPSVVFTINADVVPSAPLVVT
jgi:hypothetical protein